jgi:hypothetical protein
MLHSAITFSFSLGFLFGFVHQVALALAFAVSKNSSRNGLLTHDSPRRRFALLKKQLENELSDLVEARGGERGCVKLLGLRAVSICTALSQRDLLFLLLLLLRQTVFSL